MEAFFASKYNIKQVQVPYDANTPVTETRVSMKTGDRLAIVISMGDSVAAVATFALSQHNAATGGTTKALAISNPYYKKAGTATIFTKVEPTAAASSFDLAADFAAQEGILVLEILAEDLDVSNDFAWVSINVADTTAAKIVSALYIVDSSNKPAYDIAL